MRVLKCERTQGANSKQDVKKIGMAPNIAGMTCMDGSCRPHPLAAGML